MALSPINSVTRLLARRGGVPPAPPGPLAEYLIGAGQAGLEACTHAAALAARSGRGLGQCLIDMGVVSEEQLFEAYAHLTGLPVWNGRGEIADDSGFTPEFLIANRILPIAARGGAAGPEAARDGEITYVVSDPEDRGLVAMLRRLVPGCTVAIHPEAEIVFRLENHFELEDRAAEEAQTINEASSVEHLKDLALEAPIIRQVNDLIALGVRMGASDIHLEPSRARVELRYRVDGVLHNRPAPSIDDYPGIISRVKILAQLDIAERRVPQDGRINFRAAGKSVDIRVSTIPTAFGEDVALRLLDQKKQVLDLDKLGFGGPFIANLRAALKHSHGLILVTGPTGSGKSTCLYSGLRDIVDGRTKIITVEDPIEYEISGLTQIQANAEIGLTFANVLRSILRHDPDVIFIGEIRDRETAEIAVQSALTGHLVLSTIHTNSAIGAIDRLVNMGVPDFLIASSLLALTGQRLVRKLCTHCRRIEDVPDAVAERLGLAAGSQTYAAVGCHECGNIGYRGRMPIGEILAIDGAMRNLILTERSSEGVLTAARAAGFRTMVEDGLDRAAEGQTTIEEVLRVAR